jgi:predicted dehydrogenase
MKAAVIGLGSMGMNHYRILQTFKDVEVFSVDPLINTADFKDVDELLESVAVDFAIIATPTVTHSSLALKLVHKNIPVLIEKPVFKNSTEALSILKASEKNNCKIAVGHVERFNPACQAFMKEVKDERIINCNIIRVSPYPKRINDVGVKLDLAVHDLDLVRYITKQKIITSFSSSSTTLGKKEDTANFFIDLDGPGTANVLVSWLFPFRKRAMEILTDKAFYEVDLMAKEVAKFIYDSSASYATKYISVKETNALEEQLKQFIKYVTIGEIGDLASLEDGLEALRMVE